MPFRAREQADGRHRPLKSDTTIRRTAMIDPSFIRSFSLASACTSTASPTCTASPSLSGLLCSPVSTKHWPNKTSTSPASGAAAIVPRAPGPLFNSAKKAWYAGAVDGLARATWSTPMRAIFDAVCACATNGYMAAPESSMMKSRRLLGDPHHLRLTLYPIPPAPSCSDHIGRLGLASRNGVPASASWRSRAEGAQRSPYCWCHAWIWRQTSATPMPSAQYIRPPR